MSDHRKRKNRPRRRSKRGKTGGPTGKRTPSIERLHQEWEEFPPGSEADIARHAEAAVAEEASGDTTDRTRGRR